jgi:hypothetical protein
VKLSRSFQFVLLAALSLALLAGTPASAKATFTPIEGYSYVLAVNDPGKVKCIGGQPTGAWPPCTAGKAQIRNQVVNFVVVFPEFPQLSGDWVFTANLNLDADGKGHVWGTFRFEGLDGTVAEGTFNQFTTGWNAPAAGQTRGKITEGPMEGVRTFWTTAIENWPYDMYVLEGYLHDPKGRK